MCRFLPAPSVRRATGCITSCAGCWGNFYPRPPRGGRRYTTRAICRVGKISIHALREEGDNRRSPSPETPSHFYPRPPRGGRRLRVQDGGCNEGISIHALREEGDSSSLRPVVTTSRFLSTPSARRATATRETVDEEEDISIHALREEGDLKAKSKKRKTAKFLSTPSARRATTSLTPENWNVLFLSTPSARRATPVLDVEIKKHRDFYPRPPRGGRRHKALEEQRRLEISIHALREEGDATRLMPEEYEQVFLSKPSARRAT